VVPPVADVAVGISATDSVDALVEDPAPTVEVHAERLELGLHVAGPDAENHSVVGQVGQGAEGAGRQEGVAVGGDPHHR